jgi:hypothetical protein
MCVERPVVPAAVDVVATWVAAERDAEDRNRGGSNKRTGHDAGTSNDLYGRSHRVPEGSPR